MQLEEYDVGCVPYGLKLGQMRSVRAAFGQTVTKIELTAAPDGYDFKFTVSLFGGKKKTMLILRKYICLKCK